MTLPASSPHRPVLLEEVVEALRPRDGAIFVDATFGAGGYSRALLDRARCRVWGLDRDPDAIAEAAGLAAHYAGRLQIRHGRFGEMEAILAADRLTRIDGIAFDLGVSSMQLDRPERGFSFRADGPLDMRMSRSGRSATDLVNGAPEAELARVIAEYGEEPRARRIARAIVAARAAAPITRTGELADIVRRVVGEPRGAERIDPATRTFQAIRIWVNDEIGEIERGLGAAERLLAPGGRLAVVAFHSLEDRPVKAFLRERAGLASRGSRHRPETGAAAEPTFALVQRRAIRPREDEVAQNPRARSARLRVAERTAAPPAGGAAP